MRVHRSQVFRQNAMSYFEQVSSPWKIAPSPFQYLWDCYPERYLTTLSSSYLFRNRKSRPGKCAKIASDNI